MEVVGLVTQKVNLDGLSTCSHVGSLGFDLGSDLDWQVRHPKTGAETHPQHLWPSPLAANKLPPAVVMQVQLEVLHKKGREKHSSHFRVERLLQTALCTPTLGWSVR